MREEQKDRDGKNGSPPRSLRSVAMKAKKLLQSRRVLSTRRTNTKQARATPYQMLSFASSFSSRDDAKLPSSSSMSVFSLSLDAVASEFASLEGRLPVLYAGVPTATIREHQQPSTVNWRGGLTSTNSNVEVSQLGSSDVVYPTVDTELHPGVPRIPDNLRLRDCLDSLGDVLVGEAGEGVGGEGVVGVGVTVGMGVGSSCDLIEREVLDLYRWCQQERCERAEKGTDGCDPVGDDTVRFGLARQRSSILVLVLRSHHRSFNTSTSSVTCIAESISIEKNDQRRRGRTTDDDRFDLELVYGEAQCGQCRLVSRVEALGDVPLREYGGEPGDNEIGGWGTYVHEDGTGCDSRAPAFMRTSARLYREHGRGTHSSALTRESEHPSQQIRGDWPFASFARRTGSDCEKASA